MIKTSPNPSDAKLSLTSKAWPCQEVLKMQASLKDPELSRPTREIGIWGVVHDADVAKAKKPKKPMYRLSERQAQSILDMRLARLTALERDKIIKEYEETIALIVDLLDIIDKPERVTEIIKQELKDVKKEYGDERRTEINEVGGDIDNEDLIENKEMVITFTQGGYIKAHYLDEYREQKRGGKGKSATSMREEDKVTDIIHANSHDYMLFFTSRGRVYWKKVYQIPRSSRSALGKFIGNILPLVEKEKIQAVMSVHNLAQEDKYIIFATRRGIIKKTRLKAFANPRPSGIIAIEIADGDRLIDCDLAKNNSSVMLFTDDGKAVRFAADKNFRPTGRQAKGVIGIRLTDQQNVVSMVVTDDEEESILTVTDKGMGKRTELKHYPSKSRATKGVVNISRSKGTGKIVKCIKVNPKGSYMVILDNGMVARHKVKGVPATGRSTKGVIVRRLGKDEHIVDACLVPEDNGKLSKDNGKPKNGGKQGKKGEQGELISDGEDKKN